MIVPFLPGLCDNASALHHACFPDDPWPAHAFMALTLNGAYGFGWVEEQSLRGLILARDAADESEILTFAVDPLRRNNGIGKQLMAAVCVQCDSRNVLSLFLEVAEDNIPAIAVYRATGFQQVGERAAYYRNAGQPINALIMLKKLGRRLD